MKRTYLCMMVIIGALLFLPTVILSQETYVFERMWPALQLSWNFLIPNGMDVDKYNNIYVVDSKTHRLVKLTQDGFFITGWGSEGEGEGEFRIPLGVAVDDEGNVYVSEQGNHRIQKFDPEGNWLNTWGSYCDLETGEGCIDPDGEEPFKLLGDGQFNVPNGIDVDMKGNVYVADVENNRIQKFDTNGIHLLTFEGDLKRPHDVAVDSNNHVYVADTYHSLVLKYTATGEFEHSVGNVSNCPNFFSYPIDIAIDDQTNIYIAGLDNTIWKLDAEENCVAYWGGSGTNNGKFHNLNSIVINESGYLYAVDFTSIQKFTTDGDFIIRWSNASSDKGKFNQPVGVALDRDGYVYVADLKNCRIQKFNAYGVYEDHWGECGIGDSQFGSLWGIATDRDGNVFVVDPDNRCIKVFSPGGGGVPSKKWGEEEFEYPAAIAVDSDGNVFVTDVWLDEKCIQKFTPTPDGTGYELATWWGSKCFLMSGEGCVDPDGSGPLESGDGQFKNPTGIAVDEEGNVYITDRDNLRIQKFRPTTDGTGGIDDSGYAIDAIWGVKGSGPGEFLSPSAIVLDTENNVYVTDSISSRIQKFTSDGSVVLAKWGSTGSGVGQFEEPHGIAVSEDGKVYVCDKGTNRIQVFKKYEALVRPKAIIVAGGGPYDGNSLWDATRVTANFAYLTLLNRGFTKDDIYYLTSDIDVDMDGNGKFIERAGLRFSDDVYDLPTNKSFRQAIIDAANDNAENLVIYLTDHGNDLGGGTFYLNEHYEPLKAFDLALWLGKVEEEDAIAGEIVVIYDGCQSGSFIDDLSGENRIIVTSAQQYEQAKFLNQGTISFSSFFWTNIFNRFSIANAYNSATQAINYYFSNQNPHLTGSADDLYIEILQGDRGVSIANDVPTIEYVSSDPTAIEIKVNSNASAELYAYNVTDPDGISRVWAEIRPPGLNLGLVSEPLIDQLDIIELTMPPEEDFLPGENYYRGTFNRFEENGIYQVAIYAMDGKGNLSIPKLTTISLNDHVVRKAIIVAGADEEVSATKSMIETNVRLAYHALISQGYDDTINNDICFLGTDFEADNGPPADEDPSMEALQTCINNFSQVDVGEGFLDLVIYLTGEGNTNTFTLNTLNGSDELLHASELAVLLNNLQNDITCRVTFIYDANHSGSFIPSLIPPPGMERILITSSGENEEAYFNEAGNISFSHFFWVQSSIGATLYVSFSYAKNAIAYFNRRKEISFSCYRERGPRLEANGESPPNEAPDYDIVRGLTIGRGEVFADENFPPPTVGKVWVEEIKEGEVVTDIVIAAKDIICYSGAIEKVWAVVKPVSYCPGASGEREAEQPEIDLVYNDEDEQFESMRIPYGDLPKTYKILVYARAKDADGTISVSSPRETKFYQVQVEEEDGDGDIYEDDSASSKANVIVVNHPTPQPHNFHRDDDEDWVKFYGIKGQNYIIEASNLQDNCPAMQLYHEDDLGKSNSSVIYNLPVNDKVLYNFPCEEDGIYYVKFLLWESCEWIKGKMTYDLKVYDGNAGLTATVRGKIKEQGSGKPLDGVVIRSDKTATLSTHGEYDLTVWPDNTKPLSMRATLNGYRTSRTSINVSTVDAVVRKDIFLDPLDTAACNIDADCDDGVFCNGTETCVSRTCQPGTNPCTDDGLFCNGEETCSEENDICEHAGSPCPGHLLCAEDSEQCVERECSSDTDCDNGQFCDGIEGCANGICQAGIYPCADPTPECEEASDLCVEGPSIQLLPNPCIQLRWLPRVMLVRIVGTNTHFDASSLVTFNPGGAVMALSFLGDEKHLLLVGLMMPSWLAPEQSIDVTVTTGKEELSETLTIEQFPFIFDGGKETEKISYATDN